MLVVGEQVEQTGITEHRGPVTGRASGTITGSPSAVRDGEPGQHPPGRLVAHCGQPADRLGIVVLALDPLALAAVRTHRPQVRTPAGQALDVDLVVRPAGQRQHVGQQERDVPAVALALGGEPLDGGGLVPGDPQAVPVGAHRGQVDVGLGLHRVLGEPQRHLSGERHD